MNESTLLRVLRTSSEVKRMLDYDFDFRSASIETERPIFRFNDGTSFELVGKDASGGLCESRDLPKRPFLYVSSEGGAGILARSLENGLAVLIDLPYWHDCLHFSGSGQLDEMRRVVPLSESDLVAKRPQIDSKRKTLRELLGIPPIPDAVKELHSSIAELSPLYQVSGPDGWVYGMLFGKFTVMSNGEWRRRLTRQG